MPILETHNLSYKHILKGINLSVKKGTCTFLLGKSGSGKTTLLRCLAGLLDHEGKVDQEPEMQKGYIAQTYALFPHMTVLENCIHPQIHVLKRSPEEARERALELLTSLEMEAYADRNPATLSGGQKQRVAFARALGMDADLLLIDEPTSALDPASRESCIKLLETLLDQNVTLIISTHDEGLLQGMKHASKATFHLKEKSI